MSHPLQLTGGKLKNVEHFDVKAEIETYIRGLPVQSAFFAPASFMQNVNDRMKLRLRREGDGTFVLADMLKGDTKVLYIDIMDTGKSVGAILAEPDRYAGKFFAAAERFYTPDEIVTIMARLTGKTVRHVQLGDEVAKSFFPRGTKGRVGRNVGVQ